MFFMYFYVLVPVIFFALLSLFVFLVSHECMPLIPFISLSIYSLCLLHLVFSQNFLNEAYMDTIV